MSEAKLKYCSGEDLVFPFFIKLSFFRVNPTSFPSQGKVPGNEVGVNLDPNAQRQPRLRLFHYFGLSESTVGYHICTLGGGGT